MVKINVASYQRNVGKSQSLNESTGLEGLCCIFCRAQKFDWNPSTLCGIIIVSLLV